MNEWVEQNDKALIKAIKEGNHDAFSVLVKRHSQQYFYLAYRFLPSTHEAEEVIQDAFLKIWQKPYLFNPDKGASFTTWFYRVVIHLCLDKQKKNKPTFNIDEINEPSDNNKPEEVIMQQQRQQQLEYAILELPKRQQTALNLICYQELSYQEAAQIMEISIKALESLVMRAKAQLRQHFLQDS